jgi:hypothetical protein
MDWACPGKGIISEKTSHCLSTGAGGTTHLAAIGYCPGQPPLAFCAAVFSSPGIRRRSPLPPGASYSPLGQRASPHKPSPAGGDWSARLSHRDAAAPHNDRRRPMVTLTASDRMHRAVAYGRVPARRRRPRPRQRRERGWPCGSGAHKPRAAMRHGHNSGTTYRFSARAPCGYRDQLDWRDREDHQP